MFGQQAKRFFSVRRLKHVIPKRTKCFDHISAYLGIVFDYENTFARSATSRLALSLRGSMLRR